MKVQVSFKQNLKVFLLAFILGAVILFLCCINLFVFTKPWNYVQWIIIVAFFSLSLIIFIVSLKTNYYIINESDFEVHRFSKVIIYDYRNIIFIDEIEGQKGKTIPFMTNKDKNLQYLSFDKDGLLYKKMLSKCKNRLSREAFHAKYPGVKL